MNGWAWCDLNLRSYTMNSHKIEMCATLMMNLLWWISIAHMYILHLPQLYRNTFSPVYLVTYHIIFLFVLIFRP